MKTMIKEQIEQAIKNASSINIYTRGYGETVETYYGAKSLESIERVLKNRRRKIQSANALLTLDGIQYIILYSSGTTFALAPFKNQAQ